MAEITYNKYYGGYIYRGNGTLYELTKEGRFRGAGTGENQEAVATGFCSTASDGSTMLQIVPVDGYDWIDISCDVWTRGGQASLYTQAQAQDYVNRLIANQKQILMNNLLCARFADKLTEAQKETLYGLQERLMARNQRLLQDGLVTNTQTSEAYGYTVWSPQLKAFMTQGVGIVISTTAIVVTCVVVAALSTAAYFAYKYYWSESEKDVKYSDELTRILMSKLTPEEYEQLKKETRGIVTKAKIKERIGATSDVFKRGLIGLGIFMLVGFITQKIKARKNGVPQSV